MQLASFLTTAIKKLKQAGIDNPQLDARLLVGHALQCDRAQLLSQSQRLLNDKELLEINALLARRIVHESVARIIGKREFWGLDFSLNEATLEPRPDSETLVEAVLSLFPQSRSEEKPSPSMGGGWAGVMPQHKNTKFSAARPPSSRPSPVEGNGEKRKFLNDDIRILDLGTGTGCLLLALLHEMLNATGTGIDINPRAVEQATKNAAALGLNNRATFCTGNWLTGIKEKFDIIVSNPPYIPAPDIPALMPEVRSYDPIVALDGGEDGLAPYRLLIPQMTDFLTPHGLVAVEVGQGQAQQVSDLFQKNGFANIDVHKDLAGIERCVTALKPV